MTRQDDFLDRLSRGPAALLLGQQHLALGRGDDPLLGLLAKKFEFSRIDGYDLLLAAEAEAGGIAAWLDSRSRSLTISEHLEAISGYEWIGVWSSAVDSLWAGAFERPWRETQPVLSEAFHPADPRNRRRLHCTYLFGALSRSDSAERVPMTNLGLIQRRGVANALARRLITVLGPTGVLAIEGYHSSDWFRIEDLLAVISQMQPGQCHLFGADENLINDPAVSALVDEGLLVAHEASLASVLEAGGRAGRIRLEDDSQSDGSERLISFGGQVHSVPRDLWVQLTTSVRVVDEATLAPSRSMSADATYSAFREFLGATEGAPAWDGVSRGFVFPRDFEAELEAVVREAIGRHEVDDPAIILHGATGTGKSMGLSALAYRLADERDFPILFIDRRAGDSARESIDRFCIWAEENGANLSVVFWDGMLELAEYQKAARFFASRGRQVVLIGSAYKVPPDRDSGPLRLVRAPDLLSPDEVKRLSHFLAKFSPQLQELAMAGASSDMSFLVSLYRLLPSTRSAMRSGVVRELTRTERVMLASAGEGSDDYSPPTVLARALFDAGLLPELSLDAATAEHSPVEEFSLVQDLTALVMVPAQYGIDAPLEIVLRAVGRDGYASLPSLLTDVDLIRWVEDGVGNFFLGARTPLEARLVIGSRLGTAATEVAFIKRLLLEVRETADPNGRQPEIDFAVKLLKAFGAQGPSPGRYRDSYSDIASALWDLRTERGIMNPRLVLQEANLRREVLRLVRERPDEDQAAMSLAENEVSLLVEALQDAAEELPPGSHEHLRLSLEVERASALATLSRASTSERGRVDLYQQTRRALSSARGAGEGSFYPLDVLAWATRDVLSDGVLEPAAEVDATVEVLSAFDVFDIESVDVGQIERFHRRRQEFADLVGNAEVAEEAFNALIESGSGAGVYLRARQIAGVGGWLDGDDSPDEAALQSALDLLGTYSEVTAEDSRCQNFAFDLWWQLKAGTRPFHAERECLPFGNTEWAEARDRTEGLLASGASFRSTSLLYLRGLAEFHLGAVADSLETFRDVERSSDEIRGRRRIARSYLATDGGGRPCRYTGTVNWASDDLRRGEVYIDALRHRIRFIPREFGSRPLTRGSSLGDFHIGFNYLGVIADPLGYYDAGRARGRDR